jgi:hypothetical protein
MELTMATIQRGSRHVLGTLINSCVEGDGFSGRPLSTPENQRGFGRRGTSIYLFRVSLDDLVSTLERKAR